LRPLCGLVDFPFAALNQLTLGAVPTILGAKK
jgi:hypothetical protein